VTRALLLRRHSGDIGPEPGARQSTKDFWVEFSGGTNGAFASAELFCLGFNLGQKGTPRTFIEVVEIRERPPRGEDLIDPFLCSILD